MVAPSKSFTVIPDSDVDPDSPVTTDLMTALRDNDIHLEEWLGDGFTAAKDHDHDGTNSKAVSVAAASVGQSQLKTSTGAVSTTSSSGVNLTLAGGEWGFYPQVRVTGSVSPLMQAKITLQNVSSSTFATIIGLETQGGTAPVARAQHRFITA